MVAIGFPGHWFMGVGGGGGVGEYCWDTSDGGYTADM